MIITISGKPGSGKTSVAKAISKKLRYDFFSAGDFRGKVAMKHGMTIDELNKVGKKEFWTDKEVDDEMKKLGKEKDNFVVEGWLSYYFIPNSIKIFLDVDIKEASKRIFKDQRPDEEEKEDVKDVEKMIKKRLEESNKRYKKYYDADFLDKKNYDLIIDTTNLNINEVVEKILKFINNK